MALLSARLTSERILKEIGVARSVITPAAQMNWAEL
jgi:hypothetical protein